MADDANWEEALFGIDDDNEEEQRQPRNDDEHGIEEFDEAIHQQPPHDDDDFDARGYDDQQQQQQARRAPGHQPHAHEADDNFIDDGADPDAGMPWEGGDEEDDGLVVAPPEEAEEEQEDEFARLFSPNKKKRKTEPDEEAKSLRVSSFLAKMENAAMDDDQLVNEGKPAINKLKMLKELEEVVATKYLHEALLSAGILGTMKAWLEPFRQGRRLCLPNIEVRRAILKALLMLPLDTSLPDHRESLKKSEIGPAVMFLYRLEDEELANRRMAKELVERWSRPIFAEARNEDRERTTVEERERERLRQIQDRRMRDKLREEAETQRQKEEQVGLKVGDASYRYHARIPQAAKLDYVRQPESRVATQETLKVKNTKHSKVKNKLRKIAGKSKGQQAHKLSVEGRTIGL